MSTLLNGRSMDDLDFEYHAAQYRKLAGNANDEVQKYFLHEAQEIHSLVVQDALRDLLLAAIGVLPALSRDQAKYFIRYGVGRRLRMMWVSYREILACITPNRPEPLSLDDVGSVSRDLNVIYINILGVLDNYAWCLLHEIGTPETKGLSPASVGLFSPKLLADANLGKLKPIVQQFQKWHAELRNRRDPVAHRIPLSVPPAVLSPEEIGRYEDLERLAIEAVNHRDFARAEELHSAQSKIGTFIPCFVHHPDEGPTPIYPTVPQDIANLIKIVKQLHAFLDERKA